MSVFSNVIKDLKSFAAKVEAAFKKLFGDAPSWIAIAQGGADVPWASRGDHLDHRWGPGAGG
jgi:hypothetical protein